MGYAPNSGEVYEVPSNITGIGGYCFARFATSAETTAVNTIIIPSSVTAFHTYLTAEWSGFKGNTNLTSITISDSVVSGRTEFMFNNCTALKDVKVSNAWTNWGREMFNGCSSLTGLTVPASVTGVGNVAYEHSYNPQVFSGCTSLTSITAESSTAPTVTYKTFEGIATGGTLYHPEESDYSSWLSDNEYYLGYYLWNDGIDFQLENVSTYYLQFTPIASGTGYSQSVFITANKPDYQINLSTEQSTTGSGVGWVVVSGTPAIGYTEFKVYPTTSADTQRIAYMHVTYGDRIFATITINQLGEGTGITSDASVVMVWRFNETPQNETFISNKIPTTAKVDGRTISLSTTGTGVYSGCSYTFTSGEHILELYYNSGTTSALFGCSKDLVGFYIFKDIVSTAERPFRYTPSYASANMTNLEHVYLWSGLTEIGLNNYGSGFLGVTPKLYQIEGDCSLISLDRRLLVYNGRLCGFAPAGLNSYTFPNTITGMTNTFRYENSTSRGDSDSTGYTICNGSITSITLPQNLVVFDGNMSDMNITTIVIPNSVVSSSFNTTNGIIGQQFQRCSNLKSASISSGITEIQGTFKGCTSLSSVTVQSTRFAVGDYAFDGCTSLSSISALPDLDYIGHYAFCNCTSLSAITFGTIYNTGLENAIGDYAFSGCSSLKDIYFTGTGITTTGQGYSAIHLTAFQNVASNGTFHYTSNSNPGNIMSTATYYLGYYNWTAVQYS